MLIKTGFTSLRSAFVLNAPKQQLDLWKSDSSLANGVELLRNLVRAPRLASNFHVQNDSAECKFDCFSWKVTLCNFWRYYTKYYTVIKNSYKSLIYIGF